MESVVRRPNAVSGGHGLFSGERILASFRLPTFCKIRVLVMFVIGNKGGREEME